MLSFSKTLQQAQNGFSYIQMCHAQIKSLPQKIFILASFKRIYIAKHVTSMKTLLHLKMTLNSRRITKFMYLKPSRRFGQFYMINPQSNNSHNKLYNLFSHSRGRNKDLQKPLSRQSKHLHLRFWIFNTKYLTKLKTNKNTCITINLKLTINSSYDNQR